MFAFTALFFKLTQHLKWTKYKNPNLTKTPRSLLLHQQWRFFSVSKPQNPNPTLHHSTSSSPPPTPATMTAATTTNQPPSPNPYAMSEAHSNNNQPQTQHLLLSLPRNKANPLMISWTKSKASVTKPPYLIPMNYQLRRNQSRFRICIAECIIDLKIPLRISVRIRRKLPSVVVVEGLDLMWFVEV